MLQNLGKFLSQFFLTFYLYLCFFPDLKGFQRQKKMNATFFRVGGSTIFHKWPLVLESSTSIFVLIWIFGNQSHLRGLSWTFVKRMKREKSAVKIKIPITCNILDFLRWNYFPNFVLMRMYAFRGIPAVFLKTLRLIFNLFKYNKKGFGRCY